MNMQRVERIADFMRDAGGEQRERLYALAFNGLECFLPRFGGVVQNKGNPGTAGGFAIERRGIEPEKTRTGIVDFKSYRVTRAPPGHRRRARNFSSPPPAKISEGLTLDIRLQTDEPGDGLIEIDDPPLFIRHQHPVLDGVKQGFEKAAFAGQPLDHGLQTFCVQPADAAKHFIKKTGFGRGH